MVASNQPKVGVIMGSQSDWETMRAATEILQEFGVSYEAKVVSAHRTPEEMFDYAKGAEGRGLEVLIAGAGGAAHLPGMVASLTVLPVLGVPVESKALSGLDPATPSHLTSAVPRSRTASCGSATGPVPWIVSRAPRTS